MAPDAKPKGLVDLVEEGTREALAGLERRVTRGMEEANAALATPEAADLAPLLPATDLPELASEGPLGKLGVRLDREADLHRSVALRALARAAWMERLLLVAVLLLALAEGLVAACAAFAAVTFGVLEGRAGLLSLAALVIAGAGAGLAAIVARARDGHRAVAREAAERARAIEDRLFRLAVVMEWRSFGSTLFQDALARLEGATASPPEAPR